MHRQLRRDLRVGSLVEPLQHSAALAAVEQHHPLAAQVLGPAP